MNRLFLLFLGVSMSFWAFAQEKEESKPRIKMPAAKLHKQIRVGDPAKLNRIIEKPKPVDNMPILDPEGNFAARTYRADTTLIYKMPNKQIQVGDPAKSNKIIAKPKPVDNMPILDPEGNFTTRTYKADTTLIYKMPVKGFNADKLKEDDNK